MTLFWQQFKAQLKGLLIWTASSVALVTVLSKSAPAFVESDLITKWLETMPESLLAMAGLDATLAPLDAYVAADFSKSLVLVVALYGVILALNIVTREVDRRTIDFLLSLPVKRSSVLLSRVAVLLVNTGILAGSIAISLYANFTYYDLQGNWLGYNLIVLNIWLLSVALGSITLLASLWIDDYGMAVKALLGLVSAAYFMEFVLRAVEMSRTARLLSPFSYVDPTWVLKHNALPLADTLILIGVSVLCIGLSVPLFERKQIAA